MSKQTVTINVDIVPTLKDMSGVVNKLQEGLTQGATKMDITKGVGQQLSKLTSSFTQEFNKIQGLVKDGKVDLINSKDFLKSSNSIISTFSEIERIVGNFRELSLFDAKKMFPSAFDSRIEGLKKDLAELQANSEKLQLKLVGQEEVQNKVSKLKDEIEAVRQKAESAGQLQINSENATSKLEEAKNRVEEIKNSLSQKYTLQIQINEEEIKKLNEDLIATEKKLNKNVDNTGRAPKYKGKTLSEWTKDTTTSHQQRSAAINILDNYEKNAANIKKLKTEIDELEKSSKALRTELGLINTDKLGKATKLQTSDELKETQQALTNLTEASKTATAAEKEFKEAQAAKDVFDKKNAALQKHQAELNKYSMEIEDLLKKTDLSSLGQKLNEALNIKDAANLLQTNEGIETLKEKLQNVDQTSLNNIIAQLEKMGLNSQQTRQWIEKLDLSIQKAADDSNRLFSQQKDVDALKSRITHFFGLANAINLARRVMRHAFNAVKELDAAMTETAVVTDFSVGDMWDQLPRYTEAANKLGATTLGAYQTMTLFYQQGLDTNEAFALGTETMKMARIAGLDYADATNKMTAALRGFNMELNEVSAQRVNDVYSELAAITAADTKEIANAMTKTASIAHNANMEFETTAAFLSQIIETTRESAETAGTAMKTVIARFQELKKDPSEIGEVDGEIVDANKIETALRSVGVALRDSTGQFRDLDDVFLELASKWDGLDTNTQRYIATIAAGSRQQSRFIAMMSNYERTMELVNAANNSAGASQNQFNKTLDSLEAKLNNLKNAWNEFTMGITNNQVIKSGIDALTRLLNIINKVTGVAGNEGIGGLITAISKLTFAWAGLKAGRAVFNSIFSGFGTQAALSMRDSFTKEFGKEAGFRKIFTGIKKIKIPIDFSTKSIDEATLAYRKLNAANLAYNATSASIPGKNQAAAAAIQYHKNSILKLNQTMGINNQQQQMINSMITQGIPVNKAYQAALSGVTGEEYNNIAAGILLQEADEEAAKEKLKVAIATYAEQKAGQKLLASKGQLILTTLLGSRAKKDEAAKALLAAAAQETDNKIKKKAVFWANLLTTSTLALYGVIALIIVALAALAVGIALLIKNSPENQLKKAQEGLEATSEAAHEAASAFSDLKSSIEDLEKKWDTLDELTQGTEKWRDAIREANNAMLELIQNNPELRWFVSNEGGVLKFDYEKTNTQGQTYDEFMAQQQENVFLGNAAIVGADIYRQNKEITIGTRYSDNDKKAGDYMVAAGLSNDDQYKDFFRGIAEGKIDLSGTTEEIKQQIMDYWSEIFAITGESKYDINDEYSKSWMETWAGEIIYAFQNNKEGFEEATQYMLSQGETWELKTSEYDILYNRMADNALQISGLYGTEADQARNYVAPLMEDYYNKELEILTKQGELTDEDKKEFARYMGAEYNTETGKYEDEEGNEIEHLNNITEEQIKTSLAASRATKAGAEKQKQFNSQIDKVINSVGKFGDVLSNFYAGEAGEGFTLQDLTTLGVDYSLYGEDGWEQELAVTRTKASEMWKASPELQSLYESEEEFVNIFVEGITNAAKLFNNAAKNLPEGIEITDLGLTNAGAVKGFTEQAAQMGTEAAKAYAENWRRLMANENLSKEEAARLANYLSTVDWSNITEANKAMDYMTSLNLDASNIYNFWMQATDAAGAYVRTVDEALNLGEGFMKEIAGNQELKERLTEGTATTDDINKLISEGLIDTEDIETNLEFTAEGWKWVGVESRLDSIISILNGGVGIKSSGTYESTKKRREESRDLLNNKNSVIGKITTGSAEEGYIGGNVYGNVEAVRKELGLMTMEEYAQVKDIEVWDETAFNEYVGYVQEGYDAIIDSANTTDETLAIMAQTDKAIRVETLTGMGSDLYNANGTVYSDEEKDQAANILLEREGAALNAVDFTKQLEEQTEVEVDAEKIGKKLALNYAEINKKLEGVNKVVEENAEVLTKANRGTQEYSKAMGEVKTALEDAFEMEIDDETLLQHQDIVERIAQGETEAIFDLGRVLILESEEITKGFGDIINSGNDMFNVVSNIAKTIPPIGVATSYDGSGFADAMGGLDLLDGRLVMSRAQIEAFRQAYSMIGGSVEFETEYVWVNKKTGLMTTPTKLSNNILRGNTTLGEWDKMEVIKSVSVTGTGAGSGISTGGGGGGGGKNDVWENPYDEFYNITEQINEELRTREQIEHDYNKLLKDRRTSIDEIRQSQLDQIASLRRELDLQQQLLEGRRRQYSEIGQETYADEEGNYKSFSEWGVTKYASYDEETGLITIDWEGIDQITDPELGGAVEAYISQIEEWSGSIEDIEDEIRDIEDQIEEIKDAEKDTYLEFEERIYEALVEADQKVIDTYQELSDTISESNEKILNSLSESIELERQIRDNTKTEEEIADKEARLAYLRRDTSGANDLEIKQLEEELADARESYGDTLIDQELDRLNKVNEEANTQREQQIALMQAQLDWNEQNGIYWARVDSLLANAINSDGTFNYNSELATILEQSDVFTGMSEFGKMNWINELVEEFLTANRGFENWMVDRAEEEGMVVLANGKTASYNRDNQTWTDESGNSYEDLVYSADTKTYSLANPIEKEKTEDSDTSTGGGGTTTQPEVEKPVLDENIKRGVSAAIWKGSSTSGWGQGSTRSARLREVFGENDIQDNYVNKNVMSGFTGSVSDYTYANMKKKFLGYKTGGLADFTGPAWLDGTKTRPELVLNQQDTQNFIQLKDILSSLLNRGSSNTQTSGDNYYNIDITVEEISDDYDVDQMIERVKERIHEDASYRNVNAINFLR